jgi:hypothetical protein
MTTNPYSPPQVIVIEEPPTTPTVSNPPILQLVVVGPAVQIVTKEDDGLYNPAVPFSAPLSALAPGATVDPTSLQVFLQAEDLAGDPIGLFSVSLSDPTNAQLDVTGTQIEVVAGITLQYSILSNNNNSPDTIANAQFGQGTPDANLFTDDNFDFLSHGATTDGSTYLVVTAPSSVAGTYQIYAFVPTGTNVFTVKVQLVDPSTFLPVLTKTASILHTALPSGDIIYGYPSNHELSSGPASNITSGTVGLGVGVDHLLDLAGAVTEIDGTDINAIVNGGAGGAAGACSIPASDSGDAVWFAPVAPGGSGPTQGSGNALWQSVFTVSGIKLGDWVRMTGVFGGITSILRDFKVVGIDPVLFRLQLQNPDNTGHGTYTVVNTSITWPDVTKIQFIRVLKGSLDAPNAAGDIISGINATSIPFDEEIASARPGFIQLVAAVPTFSGASDTPISFIRGLSFRNLTATFDVQRRISSGYTAQVLVSYNAARSDLSLDGPITIGNVNDVTSQIGVIHPNNPLAMMCEMVIRSGLTAGGRTFLAMATNDGTLDSFQSALSTLESFEVYYMVPATQEDAILQLFKSHADAQSQPSNGHERIALGTEAITVYEQIQPISGTANGDAADTTHWTSSAIDWTQVSPGDLITVVASSSPGAAIIAQNRVISISGTTATMIGPWPSAIVISTTYAFYVQTYPFTKDQQAADWAAVAQGYADKRLIMIRPDQAVIVYTDTTQTPNVDVTAVLPGYYAAAAFAGQCAALPPQQPMTNVPIPGIQRLIHSNTYFSPDQLNVIAGGGNLILVQDTIDSMVYARHQLTTDMSIIENRELSIVKNVDFAAKFLRGSFKPYIGNQNITRELLIQLGGVGEAALQALIASNSMLPNSTIDSINQDPTFIDQVDIAVGLQVPYPCNKIQITLSF